jgi:peptidoglycan/LPS O-acetylase OafA/YrhL
MGGERRIAAIQGLRAVAVLLVVLYHAGAPGFSGGYVGVDVFFVISGFLITGLIVRELERTGSVDMLGFYARRIRRLAPAALFVFGVVAAAVAVRLSPWERWDIARAAIASILYFSNLWFAWLQTDYFADASANPFVHSWSLSVEEQFYLVWPWIIAALFVRTGRRGLIVGVVLAALCSFAASVYLTGANQAWAFFSMPTRIWEFALGAVVYLSGAKLRAPAAGTVGLGMIALAAIAFDQRTPFPGYAALLPAIGTALVLVSAQRGDSGLLARALGWRPASLVGDASYSWYLWHWPVLVLTDTAFAKQGLMLGIAAALASLVLALITLRLIENPIRFAAWRRGTVFVSWVAASGLAIAMVGSEWRAAKAEMASPEFARFARARDTVPRIYTEKCFASFLQVEPLECSYGDPGAEVTIALVGDSHAAQWFPALEAIVEKNGWRLVLLTKSSCPAVSVTPFSEVLRRPYEECARWRELVFQRIERLRPTFVLLGSSSAYDLEDDWGTGLQRSVRRLEPHAGSIVVLADVPRPGFHVPNCLSRPGDHREKICSFPASSPLKHVEQASLKGSSAVYLDLAHRICPKGICLPILHDEIVYLDNNHLAPGYSVLLAPQLEKELAGAIGWRTSTSGR